MSSVERDVAEALLSVYKDLITLDFDNMSREDLIERIKSEAESAKDSYISFALAYGWYKDHEEAEADLNTEELVEDARRDYYEEEQGIEVFIRIREWFASKEHLEPYMIGKVTRETAKAILFLNNENEHLSWIPKSMIIHCE